MTLIIDVGELIAERNQLLKERVALLQHIERAMDEQTPIPQSAGEQLLLTRARQLAFNGDYKYVCGMEEAVIFLGLNRLAQQLEQIRLGDLKG